MSGRACRADHPFSDYYRNSLTISKGLMSLLSQNGAIGAEG